MIDSGVMKAALFMLALGEDEASEVMKHLNPKEVQKLGEAMASIKTVEHVEIEAVLDDFIDLSAGHSNLGSDSDGYIRNVITRALGDDKAPGILNNILQDKDSMGIQGLKWMDAQTVSDLILNEHPQIIATILVHLEAEQASSVLENFTERLRQDVILRIATLDSVKPAALKELNDTLAKLTSGNDVLNKKKIGGVRSAAEIMNFMTGDTEERLMTGLKEYDSDMAQKIMDEMFVFDDIADIDDKGIQTILKEIQNEILVVALKAANETIRDKIFRNMSTRAAEALKDDLESKGPVKLSEVEFQQKEILVIVRRLADEGQIMLRGKGSEDKYV